MTAEQEEKMYDFSERGTIKGSFVESNVLEPLRTREMYHILRPVPEVELPRHYLGPKTQPKNTSPAAWREVFVAERDATNNDMDQKNFERILKVINIAEECNARALSFKTRSERRGTRTYKTLCLEDIFFKNSTMSEDMNNFVQKILELNSQAI